MFGNMGGGGFGGMMGTSIPRLGVGMGGTGGGQAPSATFDDVQGGGMNVMGSLKRHAGMGTAFMGGGGGAMSSPMSGGYGMGF